MPCRQTRQSGEAAGMDRRCCGDHRGLTMSLPATPSIWTRYPRAELVVWRLGCSPGLEHGGRIS